MNEEVICPDCEGTGQVLPAAVDVADNCPCPFCEGAGVIEATG